MNNQQKPLSELIQKLRVSSIVIRNLPEMPGYNGSMLTIGDTEANEISNSIDAAVDGFEARLTAAEADQQRNGAVIMEWIKLTDRMPNPDEHDRVLIYTEGYDFNGEQVFDVKAETLNECFYADPEDQPEVCKHASHWAAHPRNAALHPTRQQDDLLALLADIKRLDAQNLSLDLPQDIRARIERALIGWGYTAATEGKA